MVYERQLGSPIDLNAALPPIGVLQPGNYDEAIRRRLGHIADKGPLQNAFEAGRAQKRQAAAYQAAMQNMSGGQGMFGAQGSDMPVAGGKWFSPIQGFKPTFEFGAHYKRGGQHMGIDFAAPAGTAVYSPFGGRIVSIGNEGGDWRSGKKGFGNAIRIRFNNGTYGILGHLNNFANGLKIGDVLRAGQFLGGVGSTGYSSGSHLHYEMRRSLYDPATAFNPSSWFGW